MMRDTLGLLRSFRSFIKNKSQKIRLKENYQKTYKNCRLYTTQIIPNLVHPQELNGEREDYLLAYSLIVEHLTKNDSNTILNEAKNRLAKVLQHTLPYGRQFEGFGVIDSYKLIESPKNLTPENIKLAHIMSWCVAMECASYIISDDIMDGEQTRKGLPCWHTLNNIGLSAINDCALVENAVRVVLKKYFSNHHCYVPVIELFNEVSYKLSLGQVIDVSCKTNQRPRFEDFTRERFEFLADYKSTSFCYEFPLKLAMYLAGIYNTDVLRVVKDIASQIGLIFMAHNDVQDAFGDFRLVGKEGTDIQNGRCTWLAIETLERATPIQKECFMEHYGKQNIQSVKAIRDLYSNLKLTQVYAKLEIDTINDIYKKMRLISHVIPQSVFDNLLTDVTLYKKGYSF